MLRSGSTVRVRQRALQRPRKTEFLLSDLVQPTTSFARRGSRVNGGSTPQRGAGNLQRFLGAPAALRAGGRSWGPMTAGLGRMARPRVH
jgi:hypothetical protein